MTSLSVIVPVEGIGVMFNYPINSAREMKKAGTTVTVAVNLEIDSLPIGRLLYDYQAAEKNQRATDITGLLSGSYVQVMGDAMFDGLSIEQTVEILKVL